jgi:hypothetical protein
MAGQAEKMRQVLVGTFLPARRPHELESLRQAQESLPTSVPYAMGNPLDGMDPAGGRSAMREAENADDAVHVNKKHRNF